MFYVYILKSLKDSRTYIGYSNNIGRRLELHNKGRVKSTIHRLPFKLLFEKFFKYVRSKETRDMVEEWSREKAT